jgi:hypothetical protein
MILLKLLNIFVNKFKTRKKPISFPLEVIMQENLKTRRSSISLMMAIEYLIISLFQEYLNKMELWKGKLEHYKKWQELF